MNYFTVYAICRRLLFLLCIVAPCLFLCIKVLEWSSQSARDRSQLLSALEAQNGLYVPKFQVDPPDIRQYEPAPEEPKVSKVVLFTYMRGGSTLVGEMFNQHPDALYLFEPLSPLYQHIFGLITGINVWQPLDLHFLPDGSKRPLMEFEQDAIRDTFRDIFSCNMSALPVEVLLSGFVLIQYKHLKLDQAFVPCLHDIFNVMAERSGRDPVGYILGNMGGCKGTIVDECPLFPYSDQMAVCHAFLTEADSRSAAGNQGADEHLAKFLTHKACLDSMRSLASSCIAELQEDCLSTNIRAVKTIRMDMSTVARLLADDSEVKVIFVTRDPRAIVVSRRSMGLYSQNSARSLVQEAKMQCAQMSSDLAIYKELLSAYPNALQLVKYEDFVVDSQTKMADIFRHIQQPLLPSLTVWLNTTMNAKSDDSAYGVQRANSSAKINEWRTKLTDQELYDVTRACLQVLDTLGYDMQL